MIVVLDTNVLVSAIKTQDGNCSLILSYFFDGKIDIAYDQRILDEYKEVLNREKFLFDKKLVKIILDYIEKYGKYIVAEPIKNVLPDETDNKFYEVAKTLNCKIITGNLKHFPNIENAISVADFIKELKT